MAETEFTNTPRLPAEAGQLQVRLMERADTPSDREVHRSTSPIEGEPDKEKSVMR